jgi:uncharacterized protein YdeI (YjbR/CyaY-like superfamily)
LSKSDNQPKQEMKVISFTDFKKWRIWLTRNHNKSNSIWLRLYKKDSGVKSITHSEALDEALCFGWIDGQGKKFDEDSWLLKFTPRRAKSIWSKRNAERCEQLIILGRMSPAGKMEINKAKEDGRWESAYDSPGRMTFPEDFLNKLSRDKKALAFFESLNRTNKYSIAWRIQTAKKSETREKRMDQILEMLSKGEKFH